MAGPQCTSCFPFPFLTDCGNGQRETPTLPPSYPNLRLELLDQRPIIQCDQSEVIAKDVLGLGAVGLGVLTALRQVGGIAGLIGLSALGDYRHKGRLMFALMMVFGASLMALVLSTSVGYYVAMLTLATACAMCVDTLYMTLMQENVADEERGRAMGAWTVSIGVAPIGHLGLGALAGSIGAPLALLVSGATLVVASLATAIGLPHIRRLP